MLALHYSRSAIAARGSPLKWAVVISAVFFLIGIGIGLTTPTTFSSFIDAILQSAKPNLLGKSQLYIAGYIFFHNVFATYLLVVAGALFGIFPVISMALNGALIGAVLRGEGVADFSGVSNVVLRLVPHGVFELPALILASAIGIYVGYAALAFRGVREVAVRLKFGSVTFILFVVPLLGVAAMAESFVDVKSLLRMM